MKSLTYKLAAIFIIMSLVPLIVGINGGLALRTAGQAFTENDKALQELRELLSTAGDSLTDNARLQESARAATDQIAKAHEDTSGTLKQMSDRMLPKAFAIAVMRRALIEATSAERALLLALNMRHLDEEVLAATRKTQLENIETAMDDMKKARESYKPLIDDDDERREWLALEQALDAWWANHDDFMAEIANLDALVDDLIRGGPLFASASRKAYDTIFVSGRSVRNECEKRLEALNQAIARMAENDVRRAMLTQERSSGMVDELGHESAAATNRARELRDQIVSARAATADAAEKASQAMSGTARRFQFLMLFSIAGVLVAVALGLILTWSITHPVRDMARHMNRIARGDLADDVPEKERGRADEIGQLSRAMQDMIVSNRAEIGMANAMAEGDYTHSMPMRSESDQLGRALGIMLRNSNDTLVHVSHAVDRVGRGAASVSDASRSLSQGAQTSAAALEEISQTVNHVDRQAQTNAEHARQANQLATASRDAARRGYDAVTELVAAMGEIQQSGKKIATVAKLIDDIAFQTNLLALNAAVEAARAGRQGKGFSIVADEVRNLSGRSAKAAKETSAMVEAMTGRMEAGALQAERSDGEFREIVNATTQVARIFEDIAGASNEQSLAMAQIAQGLGQIDEVIQENTTAASRTAESALTLSKQADELRGMLGRFHLMTDSMQMQALSPLYTEAKRGGRGETASETKLLPGGAE